MNPSKVWQGRRLGSASSILKRERQGAALETYCCDLLTDHCFIRLSIGCGEPAARSVESAPNGRCSEGLGVPGATVAPPVVAGGAILVGFVGRGPAVGCGAPCVCCVLSAPAGVRSDGLVCAVATEIPVIKAVAATKPAIAFIAILLHVTAAYATRAVSIRGSRWSS